MVKSFVKTLFFYFYAIAGAILWWCIISTLFLIVIYVIGNALKYLFFYQLIK